MSEEQIRQLRVDREALPSPRFRGARRLALGIAGVAVAAGLWGWQRFEGAVPVETAAVTTAYPYQGYTLLNASGYVVAERKAAVATKATGRLEWLGVQEGSVVRAGEVIARLQAADVRASAAQAAAGVESAKAELDDARVSLERSRDLATKKFISASALDSAQARYEKALAALGVARANLRGAEVAVEETLIRAPFDGVVLSKYANVGDIITPFSQAADSKGAVVSMADMATLEVEADVSETNLAKIKVGQPCEIALDAYPDRRLAGEVSRLVPTVDRSKASVMTKVKFVDRHVPGVVILPEMSAKVAFLDHPVPAAERAPLTVAPPDAVVRREGRDVAFVVDGGTVHLKPVTLGAKVGDLVAVSGLKAGDKLVLKPAERLRDGSKVAVSTP